MKKEAVLEIFHAALASVDPYKAVRRAIAVEQNRLSVGAEVYSIDRFERIVVVGAGKATARMALALEESLGDRLSRGLIIVKYGHTAGLRTIEQVEASHPLPDAAGVEGTRRLLQLVTQADERTMVICLLSGGGSALLVSPLDGITLEEKQQVTDRLLRAGASINELNAVRKHLSAVKGGRLALAAFPAAVVTLILSDVIGDPLDVIASGPTAPDTSTFADAAEVIEKYGLGRALPASVLRLIERGVRAEEPETAKLSDAAFSRTRNVIIGGIELALAAARSRAFTAGWSPRIITAGLQGEARDAARELAVAALLTLEQMKPGERRCLLAGGETTVTVRGKGSGGRNQELALAFALEIDRRPGIVLLSAGTDGTDGPTDAAGAIVDGETAGRARAAGFGPEEYLDRNDSYSFFSRLDRLGAEKCHLVTGPTGTNVMDLQIILLEK